MSCDCQPMESIISLAHRHLIEVNAAVSEHAWAVELVCELAELPCKIRRANGQDAQVVDTK